jgi:hypothetical protein
MKRMIKLRLKIKDIKAVMMNMVIYSIANKNTFRS